MVSWKPNKLWDMVGNGATFNKVLVLFLALFQGLNWGELHARQVPNIPYHFLSP